MVPLDLEVIGVLPESIMPLDSIVFPVLPLLATASGEGAAILSTSIGVFRLILIFLVGGAIAEVLALGSLPSILGDLLGGIVLGISGLHLVLPLDAVNSLNPLFIQFLQSLSGASPEQIISVYQQGIPTLERVGELGLLCLLFSTGLESDIEELVKVGPKAAIVATVGVVFPFVLGTLGLFYLFHLPAILAVFAGAALTATSIGITAKVLKELGQLRSQEGQIIIGAAVLDDILGIVILAVVMALVQEGEVDAFNIVILIVNAVIFVGGSLLLSKYFAPRFDTFIDRLKVPASLLYAAVIFLFLLSWAAAALRLETVLGAFAAGLILSGSKRQHEIETQIQPLVTLFATLFFVKIGTEIDLSILNPLDPANRTGLLIAIFLILAAIAGKVASGFTVSGSQLNQLAIGVGMIPRGEVGLVFVGLGTATGVLTKPVEAALILMVITTTLLSPILLRLMFSPTRVAEPEIQSGS